MPKTTFTGLPYVSEGTVTQSTETLASFFGLMTGSKYRGTSASAEATITTALSTSADQTSKKNQKSFF
jgi:hypothetical protein